MAREHYYYKALRKTIIQFLDIFNDVRIARYASDGATIRNYLTVPLKFAPKQKVWHWVHQRKNDEVLPIMSATLQSCEYAVDRQTNLHREITKTITISGGEITRFVNPVPYNFTFQLNIWSLYMIDIDQIIEQVLPFFKPHAFTRLNISELGATVDVKVVFQSCAPDFTFEMPDEERRVLLWNMDFQVQGYLFTPKEDTGMVEEVIASLYTDPDQFDRRNTTTTFTSAASGGEIVWVKGLGYDADAEKLYNYEVFGT
jgi:hypothetical protein